MTIHLSEQDEAKIHERVASGRYRDAEEAIHQAVVLLDERDRAVEWLNRELQLGIDAANRGEVKALTPELIADITLQARRNAGTVQRYKDAILP